MNPSAAPDAQGASVVIGAILTGLGLIAANLYGMYLAAKRETAAVEREDARRERDRATAARVESVRTTLLDATSRQDAKLEDIHLLVNSAMGNQLRMTAEALRAVANRSGNRDDDTAASIAERLLAEHVAKQAAVDAQKKPP